ncbi:type II toxin-antitoxin system RelE/ParE family toxin [Paenibacillus zanthoxyli]|uniref:type II toxin-antitoxin system RelE/ParE family toxin n=1 Tax=Paenibacillus zanthoxyli TaxID=369399 RepID=UPI0004706548|nr:type II toxin-antitoxin system mRNA interferase toxin, RelE/StbE family [Paenibacillus zanthoxyli]
MDGSWYSIKFTPLAQDDLDQIFEYISKELSATQAAHNMMTDLEQGIMGLSDFPYGGSPVRDDLLRGKGYRKLVIHRYLVFYLINEVERHVVIMRVLYGSRKYESFL